MLKVLPNSRYKFKKDTEVNFAEVIPAETEFVTDPGAQLNHKHEFRNESRSIPMFVLQSWLDDGRIEFVGDWKPKKGEKYYSVGTNGHVLASTWYDAKSNNVQHQMGNCFKTREDAEYAAKLVMHLFNSLRNERTDEKA